MERGGRILKFFGIYSPLLKERGAGAKVIKVSLHALLQAGRNE